MKFVLISPKNRTIYNFRGDLLKEIQGRGYETIATGPNREHIENIEALGTRFYEIPMNKNGVNPIADIKYISKLKKLLKVEKPDAVLGYTIKPVVYGSIAAKLAGVKNINVMITGIGYTFIAQSFKAKVIRLIVKLLYKFGLSCADSVIFQNSDDMDLFITNHLVKRDKCHVVNGSGVNTSHFAVHPLPEQISFFMLSRLLKSKGVQEYLEAARYIKERYPFVSFNLLGGYDRMQDSVDKDYVEKCIADGVITRFEETSDVRPYYGRCSVYVLPSYGEGTPRTVLEAMACGRAIITTNVPGCRETVIDGVNGYLIPPKNAAALAEKMEYFINNQDKISKMGEESRKLCEEKFAVEKVNEAMLRIMKI